MLSKSSCKHIFLFVFQFYRGSRWVQKYIDPTAFARLNMALFCWNFRMATRWVAQSQWPPSLIQKFFGLDSDPAPYRSNDVRSSFIASMLVGNECSREIVGSKPGVKIKTWSKKKQKPTCTKEKKIGQPLCNWQYRCGMLVQWCITDKHPLR